MAQYQCTVHFPLVLMGYKCSLQGPALSLFHCLLFSTATLFSFLWYFCFCFFLFFKLLFYFYNPVIEILLLAYLFLLYLIYFLKPWPHLLKSSHRRTWTLLGDTATEYYFFSRQSSGFFSNSPASKLLNTTWMYYPERSPYYRFSDKQHDSDICSDKTDIQILLLLSHLPSQVKFAGILFHCFIFHLPKLDLGPLLFAEADTSPPS